MELLERQKVQNNMPNLGVIEADRELLKLIEPTFENQTVAIQRKNGMFYPNLQLIHGWDLVTIVFLDMASDKQWSGL